MRNFGFARLVRINDEDTVTYQDGLDSCTWHHDEGKQLAREEHMVLLRKLSWPYKGFPLVAAGCYAGKGLVMFGICQSLAWAPHGKPGDRYRSEIDVAWEDRIYWVERGSEPTHLPRSNAPLTRAEYTAWRTLAQPLMKASTQS